MILLFHKRARADNLAPGDCRASQLRFAGRKTGAIPVCDYWGFGMTVKASSASCSSSIPSTLLRTASPNL